MSDQKEPTKRQYIMGMPVFPRPNSTMVRPPRLAGQQGEIVVYPALDGIPLYLWLVGQALQGSAHSAWMSFPRNDPDFRGAMPDYLSHTGIAHVVNNAFAIADAVVDRMEKMSDFSGTHQ